MKAAVSSVASPAASRRLFGAALIAKTDPQRIVDVFEEIASVSEIITSIAGQAADEAGCSNAAFLAHAAERLSDQVFRLAIDAIGEEDKNPGSAT